MDLSHVTNIFSPLMTDYTTSYSFQLLCPNNKNEAIGKRRKRKQRKRNMINE